jgi:hypothetical protein
VGLHGGIQGRLIERIGAHSGDGGGLTAVAAAAR